VQVTVASHLASQIVACNAILGRDGTGVKTGWPYVPIGLLAMSEAGRFASIPGRTNVRV
jgi:hypothetical protein